MPPKRDPDAAKARFPAARIKKLMQTDEDVGRIGAGVPPLVCEWRCRRTPRCAALF